jgi:hypothetical protein
MISVKAIGIYRLILPVDAPENLPSYFSEIVVMRFRLQISMMIKTLILQVYARGFFPYFAHPS